MVESKCAGVWRDCLDFPKESGKYIVRDKGHVRQVKAVIKKTVSLWAESGFDEWLDESPDAIAEARQEKMISELMEKLMNQLTSLIGAEAKIKQIDTDNEKLRLDNRILIENGNSLTADNERLKRDGMILQGLVVIGEAIASIKETR